MSSFFVQSKIFELWFFRAKHPPSKCDKVTDVKCVKKFLKNLHMIYLYLKSGQVCNEKHHINIYEEKDD